MENVVTCGLKFPVKQFSGIRQYQCGEVLSNTLAIMSHFQYMAFTIQYITDNSLGNIKTNVYKILVFQDKCRPTDKIVPVPTQHEIKTYGGWRFCSSLCILVLPGRESASRLDSFIPG
jgi:hypothetical protein